MFHEISKHIDNRYHFIRDLVKTKEVELISVKTQDQIADIFTKPLKLDIINRLKNLLEIVNGRKFGLKGGVGN